jgi:hypothetical protein
MALFFAPEQDGLVSCLSVSEQTFCCLSLSSFTSSMKLLRSATCIRTGKAAALRNRQQRAKDRNGQLTWVSNLTRLTTRASLCSTRSIGSVGSLVGGFAGICRIEGGLSTHGASVVSRGYKVTDKETWSSLKVQKHLGVCNY